MTTAVKFDEGKTPLELLPFEALEEIGKVLEFGAQKYAANNWREGFKWTRLVGSCLRHLFQWARGIDIDPETGLSHLAHAGCNIVFLISHEKNGYGEDDRHIVAVKEPEDTYTPEIGDQCTVEVYGQTITLELDVQDGWVQIDG